MKLNVLNFEEVEPAEVRQPEQPDPVVEPKPPTVSAFQQLKTAIHEDPGYAESWQSNLAMPIMDAIKCSHEDANIAGDALMKHIFDIDADEEQTVALESQFLMLDDLRQAWKEDGKLTVLIVQEAYSTLPEINITKSNLSQEARYSLAMEGISSRVLSTIKKFWEQLKTFFGKLIAYVKRVFSGEGAISEQDKNAMVFMLNGAKQRYEQNHANLPVKGNPDHAPAFVKRFNQVGNAQGLELLKMGSAVIPHVKAYTELVTQYINAMKAWFDGVQAGEEKPLPPAIETIMPEFVQQLTKVSKLSKSVRNAQAVEGGTKPSLEAAIALLKNLHVSEGDASKGLHDALDAAQDLATDQWAAVGRATVETFKSTDNQMAALKGIRQSMHALKKVAVAILEMRFAEGLVIGLGRIWLEDASHAYQGAHLLSEDDAKGAQYVHESDVFNDLAKKYEGLMKTRHQD